MDISKHYEEDGKSMYLSFDTTTNSESLSSRSTSTSTYQTLAFDDDATSLSDLLDTEDSKGSTTLHNTEKENEMSGIMKDCISSSNDIRPFMFSHVLREFNLMSSTPSKIENPMESVHSCPAKDFLNQHHESFESSSSAKDLLPKKLQETWEHSSGAKILTPGKLNESLESSSSAKELLPNQVHNSLEYYSGAKDLLPKKLQEPLLPGKFHESFESSSSAKDSPPDQVHKSLEYYIGARNLLPKKIQEPFEYSSVANNLMPGKLHESFESSSSAKDLPPDQFHKSLEYYISARNLLPKKLEEPLEHLRVAKNLLPGKLHESVESSSSAKDLLPDKLHETLESSTTIDLLPDKHRKPSESTSSTVDLLPDKHNKSSENSSSIVDLLPDKHHESLDSSSSAKNLLPDQVRDSVEDFISAKDLLPKSLQEPWNHSNSNVAKNLMSGKLHESSENSSSAKESQKPLEREPADLNAVFNNLVLEYEQENKKNLQQCDSEDSMPSFSKSSILHLQSLNNAPKSRPPPPPPAPNEKKHKAEPSKKHKAFIENTLEAIKEDFGPTVVLLKNNSLEKKVKMNSAVRKTICEPNLQTNRPSRIVPTKKTRFSLAMNEQNIGDVQVAIRQDPAVPPASPPQKTIVSLKSDSHSPIFVKEKLKKPSDENTKPKTAVITQSLGSVRAIATAGRKSIALNTQNDKRPTPKRMPPIVKTTLNSATRKASRTSVSGNNAAVNKRRSVLLLQSKLMQSPLRNRKKLSSDNSSNDRFLAHVNKEMTERGSPVKRTANARKSLYIDKPDTVKFACTECGNSYNVKSLLEAHKKTHHRAASPDIIQRHQRSVGGGVVNNSATGSIHRCRFCDKNFVLERTLHIHLLQHCPKIPAAERRKLNFTEMDHVKKEETPHFRVPQSRPIYRPITVHMAKDPLSNLPVRKPAELTKVQNKARVAGGGDKKYYDEVKNNSQNMSPSRQSANKQAQMAPPQQPSTKFKKRSAHTGVYRTPNKDIPCVSCKQNFKSVLDYTNHMMAIHATLDASIHSASGAVE